MDKKLVGVTTFKKFNKEVLPDVCEYVKKYLDENKDKEIEIIVGSDSQNRGFNTIYSTVIAMYNPGHGAHCIFKRWKTPKEKIRNTRLLNEVQASIETAEELVKAGIPKPKSIDIDINPNPKFKSYEVYQAAKGWVEGMGYEVRYKSVCPLVTSAADWIVKA